MINPYYMKARLFPTVLTSIPVILIYNLFISPLYQPKLENIYSGLPVITDVILSSAIVFLLVQINRLISKEVFQKWYFIDELEMPTTTFLLKKDETLPDTIKTLIENKINIKFRIDLLTLPDEITDGKKARKTIAIAISQIRNLLRANAILLQHNIEYGFVRNLLGGSLLALIISLTMLIFSYCKLDTVSIFLWAVLTAIYSIPVLLSKFLILRFGEYYAKILFEQFISEN